MEQDIMTTLEGWVQDHTAKHYPTLTLSDRRTLYRSSDILMAGYAALRDALKEGNVEDSKAVARRVYLAWVQVLKVHGKPSTMPQDHTSPSQGSTDTRSQIVAPGADESPFRRYHSHDLDADILLCRDAKEAQPYWERPDSTLVAYIPAELSLLRGLRDRDPENYPANLAWAHRQKALFGGQLTQAQMDAPLKKKT